jgi:DNA-binding transcriptional regulator YhcF (GntR family)
MQTRAQTRVTAKEVERAILVRIATGKYLADSRLPTCEGLGVELSANKNTVNKAYRSLRDRGYLQTLVGRGTFVVRRPPKQDEGRLQQDLSHLLGLVVQEAKMSGISRIALGELLAVTIDHYYDGGRPRVGFIECNHMEAIGLSRDLQIALSHSVQPLLVDQVLADPDGAMRDFDILALNVNHLSEIESALSRQPPGGGHAEIVSLMLAPDPVAVTQIARFSAGSRVAIVCDIQGTLTTLLAIATTVNPGIVATGCLTTDPAKLRDVVAAADHVVMTQTAKEHLGDGHIHHSTLEVAFQVDSRSVRQLADRIAARAKELSGLVAGRSS